MIPGYNTNGFAHHRIEDALAILADIGYQSVALTLDFHVLNPYDPDVARRTDDLARLLDRHQLDCVVETGARFLLDPWNKHRPTLLSAGAEDRKRRLDFLERSMRIARDLGADCLSFWSGSADVDTDERVAWSRLIEGCQHLCNAAESMDVMLGFEPEPGMFIDTMERYARLQRQIASPRFALTLDVGHLHCLGETPIPRVIQQWQQQICNVHIEDMRRGVHDHLMFGEGEMEFRPIIEAFRDIDYGGGLHVELSRHSHNAVAAARHAFRFLQQAVDG